MESNIEGCEQFKEGRNIRVMLLVKFFCAHIVAAEIRGRGNVVFTVGGGRRLQGPGCATVLLEAWVVRVNCNHYLQLFLEYYANILSHILIA